MIYLYLKTHNKTGLKYLGKTTSNDPYKYQGSGKYWRRHIEKHGYDVKTEILLVTNSKEELKETGLFFSKLFNITESKEWANIREETGDGGWTELNKTYWTFERRSEMASSRTGWKHTEAAKENMRNHIKTEEHKRKISEAKIGKKLPGISEEHKKAISVANSGRIHTEESKRKMSENRKKKYPETKCPHCGLVGRGTAMLRYHFDNCKKLNISH